MSASQSLKSHVSETPSPNPSNWVPSSSVPDPNARPSHIYVVFLKTLATNPSPTGTGVPIEEPKPISAYLKRIDANNEAARVAMLQMEEADKVVHGKEDEDKCNRIGVVRMADGGDSGVYFFIKKVALKGWGDCMNAEETWKGSYSRVVP